MNKIHKTATSRDNHESESLLKELVSMSKDDISDEVLYDVYNTEAQIFNHLLYSDEARLAIDSARVVAERLGDKAKQADCYVITAYIIKDFHSRGSSVDSDIYLDNVNEYFLKAQAISAEIKDTIGMLGAMLGSSFTRFEKEELESAKKIIKDIIELNTPVKSKRIQMRVLSELGRIHEIEEEWDKARQDYYNAIEVAKELGDERIRQYNLFLLADLDLRLGNMDAALENILKAEDIGEIARLNDIAHYKYRIYKAQGKYELAITEFEKYFETFKEAKVNRDTENINKWDAELRNELKDEDLLRKQRELKAQSLKSKFWLVLSLVSFLIIAFLSYLYFKLKRSRQILAKQKSIIEDQKEELKELDELKSRFFANISHELRTPLTLMLGPIDSVINRKKLEPKDASNLRLAQENGNKLLRLVASILNLSKIESGKLEVTEVPVNVYEFIRRIFSAFDSYAQQESIQLLFDFRASKDMNLLLDPEKIEIVLNNLISNAIKFSNSDSSISLIIKDKKNALQIEIKDQGMGIHPDDLPYIFDRFYQSSHEGAYVDGGSGVGLALSKELIELMKGEISVNSVLEEGSHFILSFPRKEVLGSQIIENTDPLFSTNRGETIQDIMMDKKTKEKKEKTVLIVEDNNSLRDFLESILEDNYNIITAFNGEVAIKKLEEIESDNSVRPDLILTDIMMPVMDGYEFLEAIKTDERFSWIPTIVLTARADQKDMLKALRIGVDDYLIKPFDEGELIARIHNLIDYSDQKQDFNLEERMDNSGIPVISQEDQEWLQNFEDFVKTHIKSNTISVSWIAHEFALSESTLLRQLKRLTGHSPSKYIQELRLNEAKELLETRRYNSISKVAYAIGYKDSSSFSRAFKARFGKSPSSYFI